MAAQAKVFRQVKKEEIETCIEDAMEAIENVKSKQLKTNNVRTLMTRKNTLVNCYETWNKACRDYLVKVSSNVNTEEKEKDNTENVKSVRRNYLNCLDELNDLIEDKSAEENSKDQNVKKIEELETKIKMMCQEIDVKIQCHKDRTCPAEVSKSAKERMFKVFKRSAQPSSLRQ